MKMSHGHAGTVAENEQSVIVCLVMTLASLEWTPLFAVGRYLEEMAFPSRSGTSLQLSDMACWPKLECVEG